MIITPIIYSNSLAIVPDFIVTNGTYQYEEEISSNGRLNWELALLSGTNATLMFNVLKTPIDVFIVAGGKNGSCPRGGIGGGQVTLTQQALSIGQTYTFTVGESGEDSSIFNNTATSGTSTALPGQVGNAAGVNTKGEDGFYAFGESTSLIFSGRKYGAGGGCGGNNSYGNYATWAGSTAGGATGAGNGSNSTSAPAAATANTGAGGGGGYYSVINGGIYGAVGQGGSGIIIIRNAR